MIVRKIKNINFRSVEKGKCGGVTDGREVGDYMVEWL